MQLAPATTSDHPSPASGSPLMRFARRADRRAAVAWALAMFGGPLLLVISVPLAAQALWVIDKKDQNGRDLAIGALIAALAWTLTLALVLVTQ
ncbi:hypothetical protein [Nocardia rhizosphaerae]|uniref:DUF4190 domain-containing protein n=1 Tax=Nocardia rhizosphaerae TaxID=1691571 RepID=A0ABV8L3J1_9NOCA